MTDVIIVGAGPAGLICGTELERLGEKTIIIEKDKKIGEPVECAGLFNISGLERLGIRKSDYVLNAIKGARVISTSGAIAEVGGKDDKAYVVDRIKFDQMLAEKYPGELILGEEVKSVSKKEKGYEVGGLEAKSVVLATGYDQSLQKSLGFSASERFISTSQYEIEGIKTDTDFVELYVGSVAPGFFAWVIPVSEDVARVGLGVIDANESTHHYMEGFLKRLKKEGKFKEKNKVVKKSGGLIPLFDPAIDVVRDDIYLEGDCAGQVKASTGGGVMMGGLAAKGLAQAIQRQHNYPLTIKPLGEELKKHLLIRNVANKFGDEEYEHMVEFLQKPDIRELLEESGDMDFVGPLMKSAMKNPKLMMMGMNLFGKGLLL